MNPEIKALWIDALTNGKYEQGRGALLAAGRFCCLGVLCDLHSKATGSTWLVRTIAEDKWAYKSETDALPEEVVGWAGLPNNNPIVEVWDEDGEHSSDGLAELNDGGALSRSSPNSLGSLCEV
jgi:hypothetical protein